MAWCCHNTYLASEIDGLLQRTTLQSIFFSYLSQHFPQYHEVNENKMFKSTAYDKEDQISF